MNLRLGILLLSERVKWKNWPLWLKGIFLSWPSIGPLYMFLFRTPSPSGSAEVTTLLTNLEYQNYMIAVFIGFWSINMVVLGLTWTVAGVVSETYSSYLRDKASSGKKHKTQNSRNVEELPVLKKRYPILVKKKSTRGVVSPKSDPFE